MDESDYIQQQLAPCRGRYVLYNKRIAGAQAQYEEYLDAREKVSSLNELLDSFSEVAGPVGEGDGSNTDDATSDSEDAW